MSPVMLTKKSFKQEILEEITEKLVEKTLCMVNQKVQDTLKKFQVTINKEYEKTQKQLNKLREESANTKAKQRAL
jgi:hypothetical protein